LRNVVRQLGIHELGSRISTTLDENLANADLLADLCIAKRSSVKHARGNKQTNERGEGERTNLTETGLHALASANDANATELGRELHAVVVVTGGRRDGLLLEREAVEALLDQQADQAIGVEDELVPIGREREREISCTVSRVLGYRWQ